MSTLIVGVDPGATTGVCALLFDEFTRSATADGYVPIALECKASYAVNLINTILDRHPGYAIVVAVEQFVVSQRAAHSTTSGAGRITRELIAELAALRLVTKVRPAATVKPWATNRRLNAAGLLKPTGGLPHARDAARHALFEAVHSKVARDPLSLAI